MRNQRLLSALLACVLVSGGVVQAQNLSAKQAIGRFEGCSSNDRSCVRILKRNFMGKGIVDVKAQIRNGRIYWYRYNKRTGELVRLN